jgi:hypothetical protein
LSLAPYNGQPGRNGPSLAIAQTITVLIHIAEHPLNVLPEIDHPFQIHIITGAAPLRRKVDDNERRGLRHF